MAAKYLQSSPQVGCMSQSSPGVSGPPLKGATLPQGRTFGANLAEFPTSIAKPAVAM